MRYYSPEGNIEVWDEKPEGYFAIEEWESIHPAPLIPELTKEEKLAELDAQYNQDKVALINAYTDSIMNDDTETAESIKTELAALNEKYDADYQAIMDGEGR